MVFSRTLAFLLVGTLAVGRTCAETVQKVAAEWTTTEAACTAAGKDWEPRIFCLYCALSWGQTADDAKGDWNDSFKAFEKIPNADSAAKLNEAFSAEQGENFIVVLEDLTNYFSNQEQLPYCRPGACPEGTMFFDVLTAEEMTLWNLAQEKLKVAVSANAVQASDLTFITDEYIRRTGDGKADECRKICDQAVIFPLIMALPAAVAPCSALIGAATAGQETEDLECPCYTAVPEFHELTQDGTFDCKFSESDQYTLLEWHNWCVIEDKPACDMAKVTALVGANAATMGAPCTALMTFAATNPGEYIDPCPCFGEVPDGDAALDAGGILDCNLNPKIRDHTPLMRYHICNAPVAQTATEFCADYESKCAAEVNNFDSTATCETWYGAAADGVLAGADTVYSNTKACYQQHLSVSIDAKSQAIHCPHARGTAKCVAAVEDDGSDSAAATSAAAAAVVASIVAALF